MIAVETYYRVWNQSGYRAAMEYWPPVPEQAAITPELGAVFYSPYMDPYSDLRTVKNALNRAADVIWRRTSFSRGVAENKCLQLLRTLCEQFQEEMCDPEYSPAPFGMAAVFPIPLEAYQRQCNIGILWSGQCRVYALSPDGGLQRLTKDSEILCVTAAGLSGTIIPWVNMPKDFFLVIAAEDVWKQFARPAEFERFLLRTFLETLKSDAKGRRRGTEDWNRRAREELQQFYGTERSSLTILGADLFGYEDVQYDFEERYQKLKNEEEAAGRLAECFFEMCSRTGRIDYPARHSALFKTIFSSYVPHKQEVRETDDELKACRKNLAVLLGEAYQAAGGYEELPDADDILKGIGMLDEARSRYMQAAQTLLPEKLRDSCENVCRYIQDLEKKGDQIASWKGSDLQQQSEKIAGLLFGDETDTDTLMYQWQEQLNRWRQLVERKRRQTAEYEKEEQELKDILESLIKRLGPDFSDNFIWYYQERDMLSGEREAEIMQLQQRYRDQSAGTDKGYRGKYEKLLSMLG